MLAAKLLMLKSTLEYRGDILVHEAMSDAPTAAAVIIKETDKNIYMSFPNMYGTFACAWLRSLLKYELKWTPSNDFDEIRRPSGYQAARVWFISLPSGYKCSNRAVAPGSFGCYQFTFERINPNHSAPAETSEIVG